MATNRRRSDRKSLHDVEATQGIRVEHSTPLDSSSHRHTWKRASRQSRKRGRKKGRQPYTSPSEEIGGILSFRFARLIHFFLRASHYLYPQTAAINTVVRDALRKKWISLAKRNERIPPTSIHAATNEGGSYTA